MALAPSVWPRGTARTPHGAVCFGGVDARALAERYGTPLMVIDEADFRSRCRDFADSFGRADNVHYAGKAFLCSGVLRWLNEEGLGLDVCSAGELALALRAGFPAGRIALHGSNKSIAELRTAVQAGVGAIVIDSFHEIARLVAVTESDGSLDAPREDAATPWRRGSRASASLTESDGSLDAPREDAATPWRRGSRASASLTEPDGSLGAPRHVGPVPVMVRVTVGVEAHTHEFIATSHEDQKFGFSLTAGDADEAVRRVLAADRLALVGLHSHIGSQIFDPSGFEVAAHRVVTLLARLVRAHPQLAETLTTLDLGGGMGIAYTAEDDPPAPAEMALSLTQIVARECQAAGMAVPRIAVEPGRAIVGPGGVTVYEVGTIKDVVLDGGVVRRYVSIDGGMSDNIRTALYGADYTVTLASRSSQQPAVLSRLVGKHCESGDIVVRDCYLPQDLVAGDLVAVAATGAYCYAMASTYNRLPRPAVVAVAGGQSRVLLRRETIDDLMNLENW